MAYAIVHTSVAVRAPDCVRDIERDSASVLVLTLYQLVEQGNRSDATLHVAPPLHWCR